MTTSLHCFRAQALALGLAGACFAGGTWAAPATSQELGGNVDAPSPADSTGVRRSAPALPPVVTGVPQSRTVELLLQMQDKPDVAGAEGAKNGESTRRATSPGTGGKNPSAAPTADESNPLATLKSSVLGSANPNQGSETADGRDPARSAGMNPNPSPSPIAGGTAGHEDGQARESLLSNPVVRFIRENRGLTIGVSLAVLLGLWATAAFSMRRSR